MSFSAGSLSGEKLSRLLALRDDIFFKLPLARQLLESSKNVGGLPEALYLEHLYFWNGFWESEPRKVGPKNFLDSFEATAKAFSNNIDLPPLTITEDGCLANGSHRLALAIAGQQMGIHTPDLRFRLSKFRGEDWTFAFFLRKGMGSDSIARALVEKSLVVDKGEGLIQPLIVWPKATKYLDKISGILRDIYGPNILCVQTDLSLRHLQNLVQLSYFGHHWAESNRGIATKLLDVALDGQQKQPVSIFFLPQIAAPSMPELKTKIREIWGFGYQGVHTPDTWDESAALITTLLDPLSRLVTLNQPLRSLRQNLNRIRELDPTIGRTDLEQRHNWLITGSFVLQLLGLRKAEDLDLAGKFGSEEKLGHNRLFEVIGIEVDHLLREPSSHFWFNGYKIIAPIAQLNFMERRAEKKDLFWLSSLKNKIVDLDSELRSITNRFDYITGEGRLARLNRATHGARMLPTTRSSDEELVATPTKYSLMEPILLQRRFWLLVAWLRRMPKYIPRKWRTELKHLILRTPVLRNLIP